MHPVMHVVLEHEWPLHTRQGSQLDGEAAARGTTVYLTDRRLDMLPALLSEQLCRRARPPSLRAFLSLFCRSRAPRHRHQQEPRWGPCWALWLR
jgi:hypothetical protein